MQILNVGDEGGWFRVLQTGRRTQAAIMNLGPGQESGEAGNYEHPQSEQVLYVIEGELRAEIEGEQATLRAGDVVIVPLGAAHRFVNASARPVRTFNVYGPPAD